MHDLKSDYKITRQMDTPLVNVNELSVTNNETDWTVYLGETVDPMTELQRLYDKIDVLQVIKAGTDSNANGIQTKVSSDSNTNRVNTNMSFDFPAAGDLDAERSDDRTAVRDRQTFPLKSLIKQLYQNSLRAPPASSLRRQLAGSLTLEVRIIAAMI